MLDKLLHYDYEIIIFLNSLGSEKWDWFWLFVTKPINWIWLVIFLSYLFTKTFGLKKGFQLILTTFLTCVITLLTVEFIKRGVARLRPINNEEIQHLLRIVEQTKNYSFVSGHAAFSFTLAFLSFKILLKPIRFVGLIFIFPLLFAYSRLYLGFHFLSDIISGLLLGFIIANIGWLATKKWIFKESI
ncbi:MAG: phosphatase PAP2 family protein [Flavobacteriaceae bacterium]